MSQRFLPTRATSPFLRSARLSRERKQEQEQHQKQQQQQQTRTSNLNRATNTSSMWQEERQGNKANTKDLVVFEGTKQRQPSSFFDLHNAHGDHHDADEVIHSDDENLSVKMCTSSMVSDITGPTYFHSNQSHGKNHSMTRLVLKDVLSASQTFPVKTVYSPRASTDHDALVLQPTTRSIVNVTSSAASCVTNCTLSRKAAIRMATAKKEKKLPKVAPSMAMVSDTSSFSSSSSPPPPPTRRLTERKKKMLCSPSNPSSSPYGGNHNSRQPSTALVPFGKKTTALGSEAQYEMPKNTASSALVFYHSAPPKPSQDNVLAVASDRLLSATVLPVQNLVRRYLARRVALQRIAAVILMQACARLYLVRHCVRKQTQMAIKIQSTFRGFCAREQFEWHKMAATVIQSSFRGYVEYCQYQCELFDIIMVQNIWRRKLAQRRVQQIKWNMAAPLIQAGLAIMGVQLAHDQMGTSTSTLAVPSNEMLAEMASWMSVLRNVEEHKSVQEEEPSATVDLAL